MTKYNEDKPESRQKPTYVSFAARTYRLPAVTADDFDVAFKNAHLETESYEPNTIQN